MSVTHKFGLIVVTRSFPDNSYDGHMLAGQVEQTTTLMQDVGVIGHASQDHGMLRCWLKGGEGNALLAVLYAAGFNIRWLLRAIARGGIEALLFVAMGYRQLRAWMLLFNAVFKTGSGRQQAAA